MLNRRAIAAGLMALAAGAAAWAWWPSARPPESAAADAVELPRRILQALDAGAFPRVPSRWAFRFPADHGPHDAYRTEWWYLTGTLQRDDAPPVGVQLVLSRLALAPRPPQRPSAWATSAVYVGLLTVTDPAADRPVTAWRASRAALGLAGASSGPVRIWLERWRLQQEGAAGCSADWSLRASTDTLALELALRRTKPPVPVSDAGDGGAGPAPPFHLYVQPRLQARGTLEADGEHSTLHGSVSLEHAWGELPLPGGPVARDRFTLYLDDGRELFCLRTHRVDRPGRAGTSCVLVGRDGGHRVLSGERVRLDPVEHWTSPRTGTRYPVGWTLRVPGENLTLRLTAYTEDGEIDLWRPAWVGPLRVRGGAAAASIGGDGFMQLDGYDDS